MSINQIPSDRISTLFRSVPQPAATRPAPTSSFSEAIQSATQKRDTNNAVTTVQAATAAAELLNLEMMKSALSLGGETPAPSFAPLSIPLHLTAVQNPPVSQKVDISETVPSAPAAATIAESRPYGPLNSVQDIVGRASEKFGVDEALIKAVIKAESNFNPSAVSNAGAQGLMQLMPSTARGLGVRDSFNPEQNVMAGTRFLKDMLNRYNGDIDSALAAYNWGPGNVDRKGTSSLPRETRDYLAKVKSYYSQYIG